jgi:hypothetical protein
MDGRITDVPQARFPNGSSTPRPRRKPGLRQIGVPAGKVITCQFNRADQTPKLAGSDYAEKRVDVTGGLWSRP